MWGGGGRVPELGGPGTGVVIGMVSISPSSRGGDGGIVCGSGSLGAVRVRARVEGVAGLGNAASPGADDPRCRSALGVVGGASGTSSFWRVRLGGLLTLLIRLFRRGACCLSDLGCQSNKTYRHGREERTYSTGKGSWRRGGGGRGGIDRSEWRRGRRFWRVQFLACQA